MFFLVKYALEFLGLLYTADMVSDPETIGDSQWDSQKTEMPEDVTRIFTETLRQEWHCLYTYMNMYVYRRTRTWTHTYMRGCVYMFTHAHKFNNTLIASAEVYWIMSLNLMKYFILKKLKMQWKIKILSSNILSVKNTLKNSITVMNNIKLSYKI